MAEGLQRIEFRTDDFAARDRFDAWRSNVADLFDVVPAHDGASAPFAGRFCSHQADGLLLISAAFDGQRFRRDPATIARSGLDHYFIQLYRRGGYRGTVGKRDVIMRAGDIEILDLSQPLQTEARAATTVAVVVPRPLLDGRLHGCADLHGLVLRGGQSGLSGLLADHLCALARLADRTQVDEAPDLARATLDMIAACLRPSANTLEQAGPQIAAAQLRAIKRHIDENLGGDLSAGALCARFHVSRSSLYRLFEPLGGVAHYVQDRRLSHAFVALGDVANAHRRIADITFDCGFASEAHFSRAFRRTFGVSPRDVRPSRRVTMPTRGNARGRLTDSELGRWLRDIQAAAPGRRGFPQFAGR